MVSGGVLSQEIVVALESVAAVRTVRGTPNSFALMRFGAPDLVFRAASRQE